MKRVAIAAILFSALMAGGCGVVVGPGEEKAEPPAEKDSTAPPRKGGYTHASLLPRDIRSVRVDIAKNPTFRRKFELPITKAVTSEIQSSTDIKVTDRNPDSVLELTVLDVEEYASVENKYDVPVSGSVTLTVGLKWTDARTGKEIPLRNKSVAASADYNIGRGDTFFNAAQEATEKLARLVVESMQEEW